MKIGKLRPNGFTLVEIMIVVAILGLLSSIAIPSFVRARQSSRQTSCVNNLRQIDGAKDQYALENGLASGDPCTMADILPYVLRQEPLCPVGDTPYTVGAIGFGNALCASAMAAAHNAAY